MSDMTVPARGRANDSARGSAAAVSARSSAADSARGGAPVPPRDDAAVRRFIEDFASALTEMGVPRMPARVFVALVTSDPGRLSADELAATLHASRAAM